jgi:sugar lactone lactonase YvrE
MVVLDRAASYPEGPLWDGSRVLVAEMGADRVSAYQGQAKSTLFQERGCGPTAIAAYGQGFLVLCHLRADVVAISRIGAVLRRWSRTDSGARLQNPNDATADGAGGVYFSDPGIFSRRAPVTGAVMHLSASGVLTQVAGGLWYANGVYFDAAGGRLLVSEHLRRRVLSFPVRADGSLGPSSVYVDINAAPPARGLPDVYPEAGPDGIERDRNGDIVVAIYGEGRLLRYRGDGRFIGEIPIGPRYVTNLAFGPTGQAVVTAPIVHDRPPFTGEVQLHPSLTPAAAPRVRPSQGRR